MKIDKKFLILVAVIFLGGLIAGGYVWWSRQSGTNLLGGVVKDEVPKKVRDYTLHNTISFLQPLDYEKYQDKPYEEVAEEMSTMMENSYAQGGITYDEFLELNKMVNLLDGNLKPAEATMYYSPEAMLSSVILTTDKKEFYKNVDQKIKEFGVTVPDISKLKITEIYFRTNSQDAKIVELSYLFGKNMSSEFSQKRINFIQKVLDTNDFEVLKSEEALRMGINLNKPDYAIPTTSEYIKKFEHETDRRFLGMEKCHEERFVWEHQYKIDQNKKVWDQKKSEYADFIARLQSKVGTLNGQGGYDVAEGCEEYYNASINIVFQESISLTDLEKIEKLIPLVYPSKYIALMDPDYYTKFVLPGINEKFSKQTWPDNNVQYQARIDEYQKFRQQYDAYEPKDNVYLDIDLVSVKPGEGEYSKQVTGDYVYRTSDFVAKRVVEPGKIFAELKANYDKPDYYVDPKDNLEPCQWECGKELFVDDLKYAQSSPEKYIDLIRMKTTEFEPSLQCVKAIVESQDTNIPKVCKEFKLDKKDIEFIRSKIKEVQVEYIDLKSFDRSQFLGVPSFW